MKKYVVYFLFAVVMVCGATYSTKALAGGCSHGCESRGTIFTGTRLQFRRGQPIRNGLRLGARISIRGGLFAIGRPAFPGRRFFF